MGAVRAAVYAAVSPNVSRLVPLKNWNDLVKTHSKHTTINFLINEHKTKRLLCDAPFLYKV
jgi:hypothetical protein